jgi:hypothetical protein
LCVHGAAVPAQKTLPGVNSRTLFTLPPLGGYYFFKERECMADKTKRIDIRVSEKELLQIDRLAIKSKMSRSQFLITTALNKQITVFDGGKDIAYQLSKIGGSINQLKILAHQGKINIVYLDKFAGEVSAVWQSLSSSISRTEPTRD